jgi:hypothetical protein
MPRVTITADDGVEVSDGYHTFNELYAHRFALWIVICVQNREHAFKTKRSTDGGADYPGWFILALNTPYGQLSYHIPDEYWTRIDVPEVEIYPDFDGHSSKDVISRLLEMAGASIKLGE